MPEILIKLRTTPMSTKLRAYQRTHAMKTLSSSYLFNIYTKADKSFDKTVKRFQSLMELKPGKLDTPWLVDVSDVEEQLAQIKKFKYPLVNQVVDAIHNRDIVMTHVAKAKDLPMTTSFPFVLMRDRKTKQLRAWVNLTAFVRDVTKFPSKNLYAILESAFISLRLLNKKKWSALQNDARFTKSSATVFVDLMQSVIDKRTMVGFDNQDTDRLRYVTGLYYYQRMMDVDNYSILDARSRNLGINKSPSEIYDTIKNSIDIDQIQDIKAYVDIIHAAIPNLNRISLQKIVVDWGARYDESTIIGLEYLPYFIYTIVSSGRLSNTVKIKTISNSTNVSDIDRMISSLENIVRG